MGKNTPLKIPNDKEALPPVLSNWSEAINTRLRDIETSLGNLQQQIANVVKKNNLTT
jgi:hypothetical protein